jgi:hypothetical protein
MVPNLILIRSTSPLSACGRLIVAATGLFSTGSAVLFCCFSFIVCVIIKSLGEDVKFYSCWTEAHIDRIKHYYNLICQFVEEINNCFGAVLIILTASTFIRTINSTFYALANYQRAGGRIDNSVTSLLYMLRDLIIFAVYVGFSHKIRKEV